MKMAKPLLVLPAIAILALELALVGVAVQPAQHTGFAQLYIYKNGKLIYYDPDDPPVNNFPYLLTAFFTGSPNNPFTAHDTQGNNKKVVETSSGTPLIYLLTSNIQFIPDLYNIPSDNAINRTIDSNNYLVDENTFTIYASISYTNTGSDNITLYGSAYACCNIIYFMDNWDTPITLETNDTITVQYVFTLNINT